MHWLYCTGDKPLEKSIGKMFYAWSCAVFAAIGGLTFGYDIGAINGVKDMIGFRQTFNLSYADGNNSTSCEVDLEASSTLVLGLIVSVLSIGAIPGVLSGGVLMDIAGRKTSIIIGAVAYTVGSVLQTGAIYLWMLYLGRFITGFGMGIIVTTVPVYIAELSPKKLRGGFVSIMGVNVMGGILLGFIVNLGAIRVNFGWRISLSVPIPIGLILSIGMLFLPESPRWLLKKQKYTKAEEVLARVHGAEDTQTVQQVILEIQGSIPARSSFVNVLKEFLEWRVIHRVLIGMTLQVLNRFSGQVVILYYSVTIFCSIGLPYYSSAILGLLNFLGILGAVYTIDKLGRKPLLLLGTLGMFGSITLAGTLLLVFEVEDGGSQAVGYVVMVALCVFVFSFSSTIAPVSWGVNSEIHPLTVRGFAVSLSTLSFWVSNLVVAQLTPILLASPLQTHGTFYVLAGVNLAGFLFALLTLPETKGESLESLEVLFAKPWLERVDLFYYLSCACPWWGARRQRHYTVNDVRPVHAKNEMADYELSVIEDQVVDDNGASQSDMPTPLLNGHGFSLFQVGSQVKKLEIQ